MQAVVTGAAGFMGSALVHYLSEKHIPVFALVRNQAKILPEWNNNPYIIPILCDLENVFSLKTLLLSCSQYNPQIPLVFYHLAWTGSAGAFRTQFDVQYPNIQHAINCLQVANSLEAKRFICVGSIAEKTIQNMDNVMQIPANALYGITKDYLHKSMLTIACQLKQDFVWCRISNTYGPGDYTNNIINYTIQTLLRNQIPEYSNATQMCNMLFVEDFAQALFLIGTAEKTKKHTYFIGGPEIKPVRYFIELTRDVLASKQKLGFGLRQNDHITYHAQWLSIATIQKEFSYTPHYLYREGIQKTIQWVLNNPKEI